MTNKQKIWGKLEEHATLMRALHMRDLFKHDANRAERFSLQLNDLYFDYSKNIITQETIELLTQLAEASELKQKIQSMFDGEKINNTENRAVLHYALRASNDSVINVDGVNIVPAVHEQLNKIESFVSDVHSKKHTGWTGKAIDTFVNVGIGGSDLGPKLVVDALTPLLKNDTNSYFISNLDYQQIESLTKDINPETTLFIVSSKSFSTLETMTNANSLRQWMLDQGCQSIDQHFVAISSNIDAAVKFGIKEENIFSIWDWVGGRFSLWSATGLPIALALGFENFRQILNGAASIDKHFYGTELTENMPVIMGLLDVWYNNFMNAETHAFIPYDEALNLLPEYLSQLLMESNGKSANEHDELVDYQTIPISWGSAGTNAQHAYFQMLHQGTRLIPVDFFAPLNKVGSQQHHSLLLANCFAQSQALMQGEQSNNPHHFFPGNKPSNTLLYKELTPSTLGMILALFEHRTFVQGVLWEINSFDQWGVELGKKLAKQVHQYMHEDFDNEIDASTKALIDLYKKSKF